MANPNEYEFTGDDSTDNRLPVETKRGRPSTKRLLPLDTASGASSAKKSTPNTSTATQPPPQQRRQRRHRPPRDTNAPRMPLNGYVRFLNAHRERAKAAHPALSFADITKLLAAEWSSLPADDKRHYLDEAERAKERYLKELQDYQQTESYQDFVKRQKEVRDRQQSKTSAAESAAGHGRSNGVSAAEKSDKSGGAQSSSTAAALEENESPDGSAPMDAYPSTLELPIFTEEFLDHNKAREQELRSLRKLNTEYEEQNAILSKHIDNMKSAIEKLEVESVQQQNNNAALGQHLTHLRTILVRSFGHIGVPGSGETPTIDTVDEYMAKLHAKLTKERTRDSDVLFERVRAIVANLDYNLH